MQAEPQGPEPGGLYMAGLDVGRVEDRTVLRIFDAGKEPAREVHMEVIKGKQFSEQEGIICKFLADYQVDYLEGDATGIGRALLERIEHNTSHKTTVGYFVYSAANKLVEFQNYANAIQYGEVVMLKDHDSKVEHDMMRPAYNERTGKLTLDAAAGFHDDIPNAGMLAWRAIRRGGIGVAF
jgi:phage FluMu gp28-like protein